jgi:hypothetical protein
VPKWFLFVNQLGIGSFCFLYFFNNWLPWLHARQIRILYSILTKLFQLTFGSPDSTQSNPGDTASLSYSFFCYALFPLTFGSPYTTQSNPGDTASIWVIPFLSTHFFIWHLASLNSHRPNLVRWCHCVLYLSSLSNHTFPFNVWLSWIPAGQTWWDSASCGAADLQVGCPA